MIFFCFRTTSTDLTNLIYGSAALKGFFYVDKLPFAVNKKVLPMTFSFRVLSLSGETKHPSIKWTILIKPKDLQINDIYIYRSDEQKELLIGWVVASLAGDDLNSV